MDSNPRSPRSSELGFAMDSPLEEAGFANLRSRLNEGADGGARVSIADREDHRTVPHPSAAAAVNLHFHAMFAVRGAC